MALLSFLTLTEIGNARTLFSDLDEDKCVARTFIWVKSPATCIEADQRALGDWVHVGSQYELLPEAQRNVPSFLETPHKITLKVEGGALTVTASGRNAPQVVIWGIGGDRNGRQIGLVMGPRDGATITYIEARFAENIEKLAPMRDMGMGSKQDHLVIDTTLAGTHYFRRIAVKPAQHNVAVRASDSPCYAMFAFPDNTELLAACMAEDRKLVANVAQSLGVVAVMKRLESLTGGLDAASCRAAPDKCTFNSVIAEALLDVTGAASFLMTPSDEHHITDLIKTYTRFNRALDVEEAEIRAEMFRRIEDFEFIFDSVSIDGTEEMAEGLVDPEVDIKQMKALVLNLLSSSACTMLGAAMDMVEPTATFSGALDNGCSGGGMVKSALDWISGANEVTRAEDTPRSLTILKTKLFLKALVEDYSTAQLILLDQLRDHGYYDRVLASAIVGSQLDGLFPDYNAGPARRQFWTEALQKFGMLFPVGLPAFYDSRNEAIAAFDDVCSESTMVVRTVAPDVIIDQSFTAHADSQAEADFSDMRLAMHFIRYWSVYVGRPVEARPMSLEALENLTQTMTKAEIFDMLKNRMYARTKLAADLDVVSSVRFGTPNKYTIKLSNRDALAIIPISFGGAHALGGFLQIEKALNPLTEQAEAEFRYAEPVPVGGSVCPL